MSCFGLPVARFVAFRIDAVFIEEHGLVSPELRRHDVNYRARGSQPRMAMTDHSSLLKAESQRQQAPVAELMKARQDVFGGTIPIFFHCVLATFLFVVGRYHSGLRPLPQQPHLG